MGNTPDHSKSSKSSKYQQHKIMRVVEQVARIGSDMAEVLVHVKQNPGPLALASLVARGVHSYIDIAEEVNVHDVFKTWINLDLGGADPVVFAMCKEAGLLKSELQTNDGDALVGEVNGVPIGWVDCKHHRYGAFTQIHVDQEEAKRQLGRMIWERLGTAVKVSRTLLGSIRLNQDPLTEILPSQTATDLYERVAKFSKHGHNRSILLYGQPGGGKSFAMRAVAAQAGGYSLRLRASDLPDASEVIALLELLRPSAVLVDDLDRLSTERGADGLLSAFEEMKASCRLLLCSANRLSKLDPAVLRPGRFDEVIEIASLDPGVIDGLLAGTAAPQADRLRVLPVAYIHEYGRLCDVLGLELANQQIDELCARAALVSKMLGDNGAKDG